MTKWKSLVNYINSKSYNDIITRKELVKYLKSDFSEQYLLLVKNAGFIETISLGKYKKLYNIPNYITTNLLLKMAYNNIIREKYLTICIRRTKLEKLEIHN